MSGRADAVARRRVVGTGIGTDIDSSVGTGVVEEETVKRGVAAVLAAVVTGLMLAAVPAAAQDDHGNIERNEWNIPIANLRVL